MSDEYEHCVSQEYELCVRDQHVDSLRAENARLTAELAEKQARIDTFVLCMRMVARNWRAAHPGTKIYPSGADLIVWLKERVDLLAARRCETCAHAEMEPLGEFYWCRRRTPSLQTDRDHSCPHWQGKEDAGG